MCDAIVAVYWHGYIVTCGFQRLPENHKFRFLSTRKSKNNHMVRHSSPTQTWAPCTSAFRLSLLVMSLCCLHALPNKTTIFWDRLVASQKISIMKLSTLAWPYLWLCFPFNINVCEGYKHMSCKPHIFNLDFLQEAYNITKTTNTSSIHEIN